VKHKDINIKILLQMHRLLYLRLSAVWYTSQLAKCHLVTGCQHTDRYSSPQSLPRSLQTLQSESLGLLLPSVHYGLWPSSSIKRRISDDGKSRNSWTPIIIYHCCNPLDREFTVSTVYCSCTACKRFDKLIFSPKHILLKTVSSLSYVPAIFLKLIPLNSVLEKQSVAQ
jgi:hypothetical protein